MYVRAFVSMVSIACLILSSCSDSSAPPDDERRGAVPTRLVLPDTVTANETWIVEVEFFVGTNLCWELESSALVEDADGFRVEGTAVRRGGDTCATAISMDTVSLDGPPLSVGTYRVVAGELEATLTVVRP